MTPLLLPAAAAILGASPPLVCEAPFAPHTREHVAAPSMAGLPGLFEVPAAVSFPDRSAAFSFNSLRSKNRADATQQRNTFLSFGFLPRLSLTARGSVLDNPTIIGLRDISVNAQLVVLNETDRRPSLAVGAQDFGGAAPNFTNQYLVASKSFLGRARVTAGIGSSIYSLKGPFGGVEIAPCSWLTFLAENEGTRRNAGVRLAPLGDWGARKGIEPTIDLLWREGQGRMAGVGLRLQAASPAAAATPMRSEPAPRRPASTGTHAELRAALVAHGLENVRTSIVGDTIAVAYENRAFNRSEWDALGVVMAEAAHRAGTARVMRVTLLRLDLPVMRVVSGVGAFNDFVRGAIDGEAFVAQLSVSHPSKTDDSPVANASRFHLDITARPRAEAFLLTEISVAESRLSILPEASMHLARGLSVTARKAVVVQRSANFPVEYDDENADQLLVHLTRTGIPRLPEGALVQLSAGRFGPNEVGIGAALDAVASEGRVSYGAFAAVFGEQVTRPRRSVALGTVRLRQAPLDLALSLTGGRFRHGDVGGAVELERRFGLGEVAFYTQATTFASMAGVRVSLPLTGARDLKPGAVRVRLPEYGDFTKRTEVLDDINMVRADVARPLEYGQDLVRVFRGRDRLNEVRLEREVEALRAAALRWVGR